MREANASAPGRVNLVGEHTDYHDGFVLPMVIPQRAHALLRRRGDRDVRATSAQVSTGTETYQLGHERSGRGWLDYVQGVTFALGRCGMAVGGFDLFIDSSVPVGAGVSSSAALEVSVLRALRELFSLDLDDMALARLAHAAETDFVGAPVGMMDQMAVSFGRDNEALFLDTRAMEVAHIPIPASVELIGIHSGVTHAHAHGDYATRRRESFAAATLLDVHRLRELDMTALDRLAALPPVLSRRARHVITENARVVAAVAALRESDARRLGAVFTASHRSMRDDYEISTREIDTLVDIAERQPDVYGARLTGGGFGGAVVAIARNGSARRAADDIVSEYQRATGRMAVVLLPSANS